MARQSVGDAARQACNHRQASFLFMMLLFRVTIQAREALPRQGPE